MIRIAKNTITISDWTIQDADIVGFVNQIKNGEQIITDFDLKNMLENALKIGVLALGRSQTQVDINAVRREFDRWQYDLRFTLDRFFKEDSGKMALVFDKYLGQGGHLADLFDPNRRTSAIGKIQTIFDEHFNGDGARFAQLLDYTTEVSPLRKFHLDLEKKFKALDDHVIELREQLALEKGRAEEFQKGTRKGFAFEEVVQHLLEPSARVFKDQVTSVGAEAEGQSKKGDVLIELSPEDVGGQSGVSIVFECKTQAKPLTGKTGILQEITDAMNTRQARFGIAVFANGTAPNTSGRLRLYPGNRIVCSIDEEGSDAFILEGAYQIARAELCRQSRHINTGIDRVAVNDAIKQVEEKLKQFQGLKSNASNLANIANSIRQQLDVIERDMRTELSNITAVLEPVDDEAESSI